MQCQTNSDPGIRGTTIRVSWTTGPPPGGQRGVGASGAVAGVGSPWQSRTFARDPMDRPRHIAIEGPIGVGKTALAQILAERTEGRLVLEQPQDNPFLAGFYAERRKFAFQAQLFFLLSRYQQ